jgi:hypothetical protein
MAQLATCPHCGQQIALPAGLTGRKRGMCPICQRQFIIEANENTVRILAGVPTETGPAETTQVPSPRLRPWEYQFDFGVIFSKTFSYYGSAFLAAIVLALVGLFLNLAGRLSMTALAFVLGQFGFIGLVILIVIGLAVSVAAFPFLFGYLSACLSIARRKGWDLSNFFDPYRNFSGFLMMLLALLGCMIVLAVVIFGTYLLFAILVPPNKGAAPWMGMVFALPAIILEVLVFLFILLRYFSLAPYFLLDGYDINRAVRMTGQVTSHWKWLYWLVLVFYNLALGLIQLAIALAAAIALSQLGRLVGNLLNAVTNAIISAIFSPLMLLPWAVAYVEMMKQIRGKAVSRA